MKKILLFSVALLTAGAAMADDGAITFKTVNNQSNMLFYASPALPDSQRIATDVLLMPEVAPFFKDEIDQGVRSAFGFSQFIVECMATKKDLSQGDADAKKVGFVTKTVVPKRAKIVKLSLPGVFLKGDCDTLIAYTYFKSTPSIDLVTDHTGEDFSAYIGLDTIVKKNNSGFVKVIEPTTCKLQKDDPKGILLDLPFAKPYEYEGENIEVAQYLDGLVTKDIENKKNLSFRFAKTSAEAAAATVYHNFQYISENDWLGVCFSPVRDWESIIQANETGGDTFSIDVFKGVLNFLKLTKNTLPAFQFDFYTNDIRGTVVQENTPMTNKEVRLYDVTSTTAKTLVEKTKTDANGAFEFLNLDHSDSYVVEVGSYTLPETTLSFGVEAIQNDIEVKIVLQNPTGVDNVDGVKAIASVKYYDMQGVESDKPFSGVNVVVTNYNDGSRTIDKVVK